MKSKLAFALIAFSLACGLASAQVLGKIDYMEGKVTITRNGLALKSVDIGTPIENLDMVKTTTDGQVSILFSKASGLTGTLQIVPGTTAVIRQDQLTSGRSNEVRLMTGAVNLKVKRLVGMKSAIQVKTPTSVLGVRGTEFNVASFNGSVIVACKEGEVACASWSEVSGSNQIRKKGSSAVPGTMVEVMESGDVKSGKFPGGNYEANWKNVQKKWKSFNVGIVAGDPISWMNQFVGAWDTYSGKVIEGNAKLRANKVLAAWLDSAGSETPSGSFANWVKERPMVMKDLIDIRPNIVLGMINWYRLQEVISCLSDADMSKTLSNGQTVGAFIKGFRATEQDFSAAVALFTAAEKQYMLRNDGVSPFSDF